MGEMFVRGKNDRHGCHIDTNGLIKIDGLDPFFSNAYGDKKAAGPITVYYKDGIILTWDDGVLGGDMGNGKNRIVDGIISE